MTPLSRRIRHRSGPVPPRLNLTAMVDVFVVLLVFLLKSYSAEGNIITANEELRLPASTSTLAPPLTLKVTVTQEGIYVEDRRVADVADPSDPVDLLLPGLARELEHQVERSRFIAGLNPSVKFEGRVTILGDRALPFTVLERVMYTCSVSGFGEIALAVFQE